MAERSIIGIAKVEMGDCGIDGAMGGSLAEMGFLVPDSVKLNIPEPEKTDLFVENSQAPYISIPKSQRDSTVEWQSRDVDPSTLVTIFGGSVTLDKWSAPNNEDVIEQSIRLTSDSAGGFHYVVEIPRALVRASMDGQFRSEETAFVKIVGSILTPFDGTGTPLTPYTIEKVTE